MAKTINFGIDLGTTNSVIAKCSGGVVEIFRNPLSLKETLPSVVAFRKNRILVGDKAREYLEKDPDNVVGSFKRKMGTEEKYYIRSLDEMVTPVNLSAHVLRELKTFVHTGEQVEAVVITIPAAFDTIQSNATKEAGAEAGFRHVVLLQEPIAASLAYANRQPDGTANDGQWMVYDLGGGTFDVALVKIKDGEMRVVDHEGDNFLGGTDFDALIVERLLVPQIEAAGQFTHLLLEMRSAKGRYNRLFLQLLQKAEEAKIQLSNAESADIEFEVEDESGEELELCLTIQRSEFEALIDPWIERTLEMMQAILLRNSLDKEQVSFVLMVGGSTLIPRVRSRVGEGLGIPVNCNIDPTNAVGVGAAYFAATRTYAQEINLEKKTSRVESVAPGLQIEVKMAYQKTSQERHEYFTAAITGPIDGLRYRIIREDLGFDSGLKALAARIEEDLPLVPNTFNYFRMTIYDSFGNVVMNELPEIGIAHGKFSVAGQPLPNDICLEVDDLENETTKLEPVFRKNEVLPLRRTLIKTLTRSLRMGAEEEVLIQLLEGPESALPAANQPIGHIAIKGKDLQRDLIKGSDVEIAIEISESRDLRISAYLMLSDQEFSDVFKSARRYVHPPKLAEELAAMIDRLEAEQDRNEDDDTFTARAAPIMQELVQLRDEALALAQDDVTDARYQLEDKKRKLAQRLSDIHKEQEVTEVKLELMRARRHATYWIEKYGTEPEKKELIEIQTIEKQILQSNHVARIRDAADRLWSLAAAVRWRTMEFLASMYAGSIKTRMAFFAGNEKSQVYIKMAEEALVEEDVYKMQQAISQLWDMLPQEAAKELRYGTGIG
jgi:molecular chaperone DnaK